MTTRRDFFAGAGAMGAIGFPGLAFAGARQRRSIDTRRGPGDTPSPDVATTGTCRPCCRSRISPFPWSLAYPTQAGGFLNLLLMGGASNRIDPDSAVVPAREGTVTWFQAGALWTDQSLEPRSLVFVEALWAVLSPVLKSQTAQYGVPDRQLGSQLTTPPDLGYAKAYWSSPTHDFVSCDARLRVVPDGSQETVRSGRPVQVRPERAAAIQFGDGSSGEQDRETEMSSLAEYANKYETVRMERRDGVLLVTLHTAGDSLRWGFLPHGELPEAFHDIGVDRENRVVILTGTGHEFSGPRATPGTSSFPARPSIERIDRIHWEGRHLLMNLLNIEVPVISAINGPAWRHSEIPLLCDIVLAADTAQFQDSAHFASDVVPGDGMHIVYPLLLGMNRGRYFLLTGQTLDAREALRLGLVAEVLPPEGLLARAWELAEDLTRKPTLLLRYTRLLFTEYLRRQMHELLGYGLAMESLALFEKPEAPPEPR